MVQRVSIRSVAEMTEDELAARAVKNSPAGEQALEELLERLYPWITRTCLLDHAHGSSALDCAQEVMIQVAKSIHRFKGDSSIRTWVYRIMKRVIIRSKERERKMKFRFPLGQERDTSSDELIKATEPLPDSLLLQEEQRHELLVAIRTLPEKQRDAVFLHYFEQLSVVEGAECLGCSESSFKTHLFRARKSLELKLEQQD